MLVVVVVVVVVVVIYLHEKPVEGKLETVKGMNIKKKNIQYHYHLCNPKLTPCK